MSNCEAEARCIDIYEDFDESEIEKESKSIQMAWKCGKELKNPPTNRRSTINDGEGKGVMLMEGLELKYFVLKPGSKKPSDPYARASRLAMREYARAIKYTDRKLAQDLFAWADRETQAEENMRG